MDYQTIFTMKESEKATVELAAMEGHIGPVVVKRLRGANPDIYRLLSCTPNSHIPQLFACEQKDGELIVAEEYVDGENLEEHLNKNSLSDEEKLKLALQLCEAVDFLHGMEPAVIHRDIKPSNILITEKGVLKLIDFDASRRYSKENDGDTRLLGTVEYAPPEQFGYAQTDARSDIYSMGVVLHSIQLPENKKMEEVWEKVLEKCTSFDPKNRYQNVQELKKEIEKLLAWKSKRKKKIVCSVAAAVIVPAVLYIGATALMDRNEQEVQGLPETGIPTPTEMSLPTDIPTPLSEPTKTPSPVPTIAPIQTPSPTPTLTPTPSPTMTPTPELTATPTPDSEEVTSTTVMPTEWVARYIESMDIFVEHVYKGMEPKRDLILYASQLNLEKNQIKEISLYEYTTNQTRELPDDVWFIKNNMIYLKNSYIQTLSDTYYRVNIECGNVAVGMTLLLHPVGAEIESEVFPLHDTVFEYEADTKEDIYLHTRAASSKKIVTIELNEEYAFSSDEELWIDSSMYELLEDNTILVLSKELLLSYQSYTREGRVRFNVYFDDGSREYVTVNYK